MVPVPGGDTAVIELGELTVKLVALAEPKLTAVAPLSSLPVIVTEVPPAAGPALGLVPLTAGEAAVKTQAAPSPSRSQGPPISAVLPFADSDKPWPKAPEPCSSLPVSFEPCCVQDEPERVNTQAAPATLLSEGPPISATEPSAESAAPTPKRPPRVSSLPVSFEPCWVQPVSERVNTHAAPALLPSLSPPTSAVLPSAEIAVLSPNWPWPLSPAPVSFSP